MIEQVELLRTAKEWLLLFASFLFLLSLSLGWEYYNYKKLIKFDSALVTAKVLNQYTKTKTTKSGKERHYQILKLKAQNGFTFYTVAKRNTPDIISQTIDLEIFTGKEGNISFLDYLKGFFAPSKIIKTNNTPTYWKTLQGFIIMQHDNTQIQKIYEALYLAKPLPKNLQQTFSTLGLSHLIAISGFHLGVLSLVVLFFIKYPYKFFQNRYFPYRSYQRDSFVLLTVALLSYTLFLGAPPSLLRAFVMLIVGFFLYDRGVKIVSMQTLLLTVLLLIALFPRLFFALGLWLSVAGVFYIFLFLDHFKEHSKIWQFIFLPVFVYLMMLPYSVIIFGNFSLYHPLSILYTTLFTLFYPLSILLHVTQMGDLLDGILLYLIQNIKHPVVLQLPTYLLVGYIGLSLGSVVYRKLFYILLLCSCFFCIYLIKYVA